MKRGIVCQLLEADVESRFDVHDRSHSVYNGICSSELLPMESISNRSSRLISEIFEGRSEKKLYRVT